MTASLQAVVSAYTPLQQSGNEWRGACPECEQDALLIHEDAGRCMECGWRGGALEYLLTRTGCTEDEARARLGNGEFHEPPPAELLKRPSLELVPVDDVPPDVDGWHCYRNAEGEPWAYSDGSKWRTHGRYGPDDPPRWYKRAPAVPRPLYGLERLHMQARVILCESEREADVAARLFPRNPCCAAQGQHGHKLTDWTPLAGRAVLLVPRNDAAGQQAMQRVAAALLQDVAGCVVSGLDTTDQPEDWTLCDAADWTPEAALEWAKGRITVYPAPVAPAPPPVSPPPPPVETSQRDPDATAGHSEPDMPPPEFPPEATAERPKRARRPRLSVVDGNTVRREEIEPEAVVPVTHSEDALADQWSDGPGEDYRYTPAWGTWFRWGGATWREDSDGDEDTAFHSVRLHCRRAAREAAELTAAARQKITTAREFKSVLAIAGADRRHLVTADRWDVDPYLLGTPAGVIDLRTGLPTEAEKDQLIRMSTSVAPVRGEHPLFDMVIGRAAQNDEDMLVYLWGWMGYCLTGDTRLERLMFLHGPGGNGKGTLVKAVADILGTYACTIHIDALLETKHERHSQEIAKLQGKRYVYASEVPSDARWNESALKWLTGGDKVVAHKMRMDDEEWYPRFKLLAYGNSKPALKSVGDAIKRRLDLVEYPGSLGEENLDTSLKIRLREEYPAILATMIEHCLRWQEADYKLDRPNKVKQDVQEYLDSEDLIGRWMADCVVIEAGQRTQSSAAFQSYKEWAKPREEYVPSQKRFTGWVKDRGIGSVKSGPQWFVGFRLRGVAPDAQPQGVDV